MTQTLNITAICSQLPKQVEEVSRRTGRRQFAVLDRLRASFTGVPAAEIKRVARAIWQVRASATSTTACSSGDLPPHAQEGGGDA